MKSNPPITIKEARKILGKNSKVLSDAQVQEIIDLLTDMARKYIYHSGSK